MPHILQIDILILNYMYIQTDITENKYISEKLVRFSVLKLSEYEPWARRE